jgi:hypothetical protein
LPTGGGPQAAIPGACWQTFVMDLRSRLDALGLAVPAAVSLPPSGVNTFSWIRVLGQRVLNAFSEVVIGVFGPEIGAHARTAIGVVAVPLNLPVVIAAKLHLGS